MADTVHDPGHLWIHKSRASCDLSSDRDDMIACLTHGRTRRRNRQRRRNACTRSADLSFEDLRIGGIGPSAMYRSRSYTSVIIRHIHVPTAYHLSYLPAFSPRSLLLPRRRRRRVYDSSFVQPPAYIPLFGSKFPNLALFAFPSSTISLTTLPVPGAFCIPQQECPLANIRFFISLTSPI